MLIAALRDLQWRRRRFLIAVLGTSLVFGLTLVMTGVSSGFAAETASTVRGLRADGWVVREGAAGPFLGAAPMFDTEVFALAGVEGIDEVAATAATRKSVLVDGTEVDVNVFGSSSTTLGMPEPTTGRSPEAPGEILISTRLAGFEVGEDLRIAGVPFRVVGEVSGASALAGAPNVYLRLADAQAVGFAGQPVATAIAYRGTPTSVPAGFQLADNSVARSDLLRAVEKAKSSITLITALLWMVAAAIIGAVVYLTVLERQRDFAVFKAVGVATRSILGGLALQAAILAVIAALLGSVIGTLLAPVFPMLVSLELQAHLLLPFVAVAVGLLASLVGLRRVVATDPALAFGGP